LLRPGPPRLIGVRNLGIGPTGIATGLDSSPASLAAAVAVEELGYPTLWLSGGALPGLQTVVDLVRATSTLKIATGILSVDTYSPADVAATYAGIEAEQPGRFLVGLGGAHGPRPLATLKSFLDQLDAVPRQAAVSQEARILAALGPRMLELARDRTAGAYPVLVTPEYTAQARTILGDDRTLAVQQFAVVETDADRARAMAREPIAFLSKVPGYAANLARMGFSADEIDRLDDRLVDALTAWGDPSAIAARVAEHHEAGADHVSINVLTGVTGPQPIEQWRALTRVLLS
jgi:probable F420-dependent oxidoreductase